jgi:hypothetical protein
METNTPHEHRKCQVELISVDLSLAVECAAEVGPRERAKNQGDIAFSKNDVQHRLAFPIGQSSCDGKLFLRRLAG